MSEFRVGDRVEFVYEHALNNGQLRPGSTGTIVAFRSSSPLTVGVEWDEEMGGHSLMKRCRAGHGWWMSEADIAPHSEEPFEPAGESELMQFLFSK